MASSDLVKNGDATLSIRRFEVIFFDGPTGFSLGTPEGFEEGSAVTEVVRGGPADRAKIKVGDVLVETMVGYLLALMRRLVTFSIETGTGDRSGQHEC